MSVDCPHLTLIATVPADGTTCPACVQMGSTWVNLRQCRICGQVGCCDSSPNTHATRHFQSTGHPIMRSIMPDQDWSWCYVCELQFRERDGRFVAIDGFLEAGLWFASQLPAGVTIADLAPDAVVEEGFALGSWVTTYRERGRQGELDDDARATLQTVPGWRW